MGSVVPVGNIHVTTRTGGVDLDPDGYQVTVDQDTRPMTANDFERFQNLAFGAHSVTLSSQADNCSVVNNPRLITVSTTSPQYTTSTTFDVTCVANVAGLTVETLTVGNTPDPDGYTLTVLGQTKPAPLNGFQVFNQLAVGNQSVLLGSLMPGCEVVLGSNPRAVPILFNGSNSARFVVACSVGLIEVVTATTGVELDPNGYSASVDNAPGALYSVAVNAATLLGDFFPIGAHQVGLGNVSPNCTVAGANPRTVTVATQAPVQTRFDVACGPAVRVAFESNRDGDFEIFSVRPDGTELRQLTTNTVDDGDPDWSPDGTRLAFVRGGDIWVMDADGGNQKSLLSRPEDDDDPDWSPDGKYIVFEGEVADKSRELFVMNADGTNVKQLTNAAGDSRKPHFSPNGSFIVFVSDRSGNDDVFIMPADGTSVRRLTTTSGVDESPAWSPIGDEIVFASDRDGDMELWVMNADGSGQRQLTFNSTNEGAPAWGADGTIAFSTDRNGNIDIYLRIGTTETPLAIHAKTDSYPDWRPVPRPPS